MLNKPASSLNEVLRNALQANFLPFKSTIFSCTHPPPHPNVRLCILEIDRKTDRQKERKT